MASTTAEVLLYFGTDDPEFRKAVDTIRFITTPQMETREIINLIGPIYSEGYNRAERDISSE